MKHINSHDIAPKRTFYQQLIAKYKKGIIAGDFYEEPIEVDFIYPDW